MFKLVPDRLEMEDLLGAAVVAPLALFTAVTSQRSIAVYWRIWEASKAVARFAWGAVLVAIALAELLASEVQYCLENRIEIHANLVAFWGTASADLICWVAYLKDRGRVIFESASAKVVERKMGA